MPRITFSGGSKGLSGVSIPGKFLFFDRRRFVNKGRSTDDRNFEKALDRSLRDIMKAKSESPARQDGDLRQTLLVVEDGSKEDTRDASISRSPLWRNFKPTENMYEMDKNEIA
jgi:hypothetical protein